VQEEKIGSRQHPAGFGRVKVEHGHKQVPDHLGVARLLLAAGC